MHKQWKEKSGTRYQLLVGEVDGTYEVWSYGTDPDTGEYTEDRVIRFEDHKQALAYIRWLDKKGEFTDDCWSYDDAAEEIGRICKQADNVAGIWRKWYAVGFRGMGPSVVEHIGRIARDFLTDVTLAEEGIRRGCYESNSYEVDLIMELRDVAAEAVLAADCIVEMEEAFFGRKPGQLYPQSDYSISGRRGLPDDLFVIPKVVGFPPDPPMPEPPELPSVVLEVVRVHGDVAQVGISDMFGATVYAEVDVDEPVEVGHAVVIRARKFSSKNRKLVDAVYDGFADQAATIADSLAVAKLKYDYTPAKAQEAHEDYCFKLRQQWEIDTYGERPTRQELDAAEKRVFGANLIRDGWTDVGQVKTPRKASRKLVKVLEEDGLFEGEPEE